MEPETESLEDLRERAELLASIAAALKEIAEHEIPTEDECNAVHGYLEALKDIADNYTPPTTEEMNATHAHLKDLQEIDEHDLGVA